MSTSLIRYRSLLACASGLLSFLVFGSHLAGQVPSVVLRGRVADAADDPIPAAVVVLHAVGEDSGVEVARDTADADGRFELTFTPESGPLYFVATRIDGDIFTGTPFREPPSAPLVLLAGQGVEPLRLDGFETSPTSVTGAERAADDSHGGWWVAALALALVGLIVWFVHRGRHRPPRARELLLEIARLDENREPSAGTANDDAWRTRRAALRERLVEALELDHDAHRH